MKSFFPLCFLLITFLSSVFPQDPDSTYQTKIFLWGDIDQYPSNTTPFCWVGNDPYQDLFDFKDYTGIKNFLDTIPSGGKVLFLWNRHIEMLYHSNDVLRDSSTNEVLGYRDTFDVFHPYPNIWWDHGADSLGEIHFELFKNLSEQDVEIDVLVLDFEERRRNWDIYVLVKNFKNIHPDSIDAITKDYFSAIQSDKRAQPMFDSLGFSDLSTVDLFWTSDNYLFFNEYMLQRRREYMNTAVFDPFHHFYPKSRSSNYESFYVHEDYPIPDYNGHRIYKYPNKRGHVGTHQTQNMYGYLGQISTTQLPDNVEKFDKTPFNSMLYTINKCAAMARVSEVPFMPWIGPYSWDLLINNNDYYMETVYHSLQCGADDILFWDYSGASKNPQEDANLLAKLVKSYDNFWVASPPDSSLFYPPNEIINWNSSYVLTGRSSDSTTLWRFTPKLDEFNTDPISFLVPNTDSLTFLIEEEFIYFPKNAYIVEEDDFSEVGIWIRLDHEKTISSTTSKKLSSKVILFPNPASNELFITSSSDFPKNIFVKIRDIKGNIMLESKAWSKQKKLSLEGLHEGIYIVEIHFDQYNTEYKKLVIVH